MIQNDPSLFGNDPVGPVTEAEQFSAGGVLYSLGSGRPKVCLISKRQGRIWAFPRGRINPGETTEENALREVLEETGYKGTILHKLGEVKFFFLLRESQTFYRKTVTFYLMKLASEDAQPRDGEADAVGWFEPGDAHRRLTYINEKKLLKQTQGLLL